MIAIPEALLEIENEPIVDPSIMSIADNTISFEEIIELTTSAASKLTSSLAAVKEALPTT